MNFNKYRNTETVVLYFAENEGESFEENGLACIAKLRERGS